MKNISSLFTTGEFAKVCNTTKDTLFHYDEIGVLKPEITMDNGYRYYTLKQIYIFSLIRTLRDCGSSLNEIKDYLDMDDPDNITEFINDKKSRLSRQIDIINQSLRFLGQTAHAAELMRSSADSYPDTPGLKDIEEMYIIATPTGISNRTNSHESASVLAEHFKYCDNNRQIDKYPIGRIISKNTLFSGELFYSYVFSIIDHKIDDAKLMTVPAGTYAFVYHHGDYDTIGYSYQKLINYVMVNGYHISSDVYELEANNFMRATTRKSQIIEIMVKIDTL